MIGALFLIAVTSALLLVAAIYYGTTPGFGPTFLTRLLMTMAYFLLMSHWRDGAIAAYLENDPTRYQNALGTLANRRWEVVAENTKRGTQPDDRDYKTLGDCADLEVELMSHLASQRYPTACRGRKV